MPALMTLELFVIQQAWYDGMDVEDLADGYGPGQGTFGDWSGIRDSSHGAIESMLARAMDHFWYTEPMPPVEFTEIAPNVWSAKEIN